MEIKSIIYVCFVFLCAISCGDVESSDLRGKKLIKVSIIKKLKRNYEFELINYSLKMGNSLMNSDELRKYMGDNSIRTIDSVSYFINNDSIHIEYINTYRGMYYNRIYLINRSDSCFVSFKYFGYSDETLSAVEGNAKYNFAVPLSDVKCDCLFVRQLKIKI